MQRWVEAFIHFGARLAAAEEIDNAVREREELRSKEKVAEVETIMEVLIDSLDDQAPCFLAVLEDIIRNAPALEILEIMVDPITNQITKVIIVKQIMAENKYLDLWFPADYMF